MSFHDDPSDEVYMTHYFEFAALYLYKYALKLLQDQRMAEDAVQGTFAEMIRYFDRIRGFTDQQFLAYAKRELEHQCAKLLRHQKMTVVTDDFPEWSNPSEEPVIDFVERKATQQELHQCLRKMSPHYRQVLHLYYFENQTSEQIGQFMHLSPGYARMLLTRARTQLKQIYQKEILDKTSNNKRKSEKDDRRSTGKEDSK